MSGKEKLLDRIKSDSDANIKAIEDKAQAEYDRIINSAKQQIELNNKENNEQTLKKIAQINAGTKSKVELEIRNAILKKRREEIDLTIDMIKDYLLNLGDNEYFEAIYKLASKLSGENGTVFLNEKDLKRVPSDFESRLKSSGLDANLSREAVDIDGGFILKSGNIEENMSYEAVFRSNRDMLEDLISQELFAL